MYISRIPKRPALVRAKENVARFFPVVGVMEDLAGFFDSLDFILPHYFRDAKKVYDLKYSKYLPGLLGSLV